MPATRPNWSKQGWGLLIGSTSLNVNKDDVTRYAAQLADSLYSDRTTNNQQFKLLHFLSGYQMQSPDQSNPEGEAQHSHDYRAEVKG